MKITMNDSRLTNINQLKQFLKGSQKLDLSLRKASINEKYKFIDQTVDRFKYFQLRKKDKRIIISYIKKITGYKKAQLYRLVKRAVTGKLKRKKYNRINPNRIYTACDIKLLEKTDELHSRLSEKATQRIFRRESEIFSHQKYENIAGISHAHITNLRSSSIYKNSWVNHTKARQVPIGVTMKPENYGKPGSIRVDTVHQRDIYHMLLIKQTKNRAYRSNDNALAETKNGSVVRKNMGWEHIHKNMVDEINSYYKNYFNPYLNYYRPCGFPTITIDKKGRKKKTYDVY